MRATDRQDRLYDLMPVVYRVRDVDQGYPLRALLRVIGEQVDIVEDDIARLYENWFIETCQDWVVPYIGSLIGYQPRFDVNELGDVETARGIARNRLLVPRAEVSRTIGFRRRKGTARLLEAIAMAVGGWPARAVEFRRLLGLTQNINYPHFDRGRFADLRDGDALENIDGPFDELAHTVDVRRPNSGRTTGRANIPSVGVYIWRLRSYSVTETPAFCYEEESPNCYLFSVLGNDSPLFTRPGAASSRQPRELDLPAPIRRRSFERHLASYYGDRKSLQIWTGSPRSPVPVERIVAADLSDWSYRPSAQQVAVDPELGRILFPTAQRKHGVWVSYHYGFSTEIGGGEYERPLLQPPDAVIYAVGEGEDNERINDALAKWQSEAPVHAVIEITDSGVYVEPIRVSLKSGQTLQLRAGRRKTAPVGAWTRPVIRLLDWQTSHPDNLSVTGETESWFTIDGLLITGRGVQIEGAVSGVTIRHSTLVPGWALGCDCEPLRATEASLELLDAPACLTIEHSIVGAIRVERDEAKEEPLLIRITDSIVDATSPERVALGASEHLCAHATLTIRRSTVIGELQARELDVAENSILIGVARICRRQSGCVRFSYVSPGSRTPRRYQCQPDLVLEAIEARAIAGDITPQERDAMTDSERLRVEPVFTSVRYGTPGYCQLASACAPEITTGAEDESEMGVFHDLYQPQRLEALRAALADYTPAGTDAGVLPVT